MSVTIGKARLELHLADAFSLKDKRSEVKRLTTRIANRFNCAIAEIEDLDDIRVATIGIVVLSTSPDHAQSMLATIVDALERLLEVSTLEGIETELIPFGD